MGDKSKLRKGALAFATGGGSLMLEAATDPFTRPAEKAARTAEQASRMEQKQMKIQQQKEQQRLDEATSEVNRRKLLGSSGGRQSLMARSLGG